MDHQDFPLHPDHRADLNKSGLSEDTIRHLRISAVRPHDIKLTGVLSAYRLPYYDLDGKPLDFERWRLFPPIVTADGHTRKYHQAAGTTPYLYLPTFLDWRAVAADASRLLIITEGEKKAAAGCQGGLIAAGNSGVWCWRMKLEHGERLFFQNWTSLCGQGGGLKSCLILMRGVQTRSCRCWQASMPWAWN